MKILFTSDLHGEIDTFKSFVRHLNSDFDIGVISGDLLEDAVTLDVMKETLSLDEDDLLEELYDPEDTIEDLNERIVAYKTDPESLLSRTLIAKEKEYRDILSGTNKKIVVIPGNHDLSKWESKDNIVNVNMKRYDIAGLNFVGFRYTRLEISEEDEYDLLQRIEPLVDKDTILVTHAPPLGIRDKNIHGISIGSKCIRDLIEKRNFRLHLFGHVHESFGRHGKHINGAFPKKKRFISIKIGEN